MSSAGRDDAENKELSVVKKTESQIAANFSKSLRFKALNVEIIAQLKVDAPHFNW